MSTFVLDTDTLSLLQQSYPTVVQRVAVVPASSIAITIVTAEEQLRGWLATIRQYHANQRQIRGFQGLRDALASFARFTILDFDLLAFERFVVLRRAHPRLGAQELRIAAITLSLGATLVTRNKRDFSQILDLPLDDWSSDRSVR